MNISKDIKTFQADHLVTHVVTLGMTGSGKTGLGTALLEELMKLKIPMIILDIKGDLSHIATATKFIDSLGEYFVHTYVPEGKGEIPPTTLDLLSKEGNPGATIVYLAHLSFDERAVLISRILTDYDKYMRSQGGSDVLKALLHIDEIHGLIPPVKKSPVKEQLMLLLKQARGFGFGVSLATQNPGDLDYRALSNIGTWFIGKLTTDRDRSKVLEGLEGSVDGDALKKLKHRQFILRSVYQLESLLLKTRNISSAIGGPLTLNQALEYVDKRFTFKYRCELINLNSRVNDDHDTFVAVCRNTIIEQINEHIEGLKTLTRVKLKGLEKRQKSLQNKIEQENTRKQDRTIAGVISSAVAVISALTSKTSFSTTNVTRTGSAVRNVTKAKATGNKLKNLQDEMQELEAEVQTILEGFEAEVQTLKSQSENFVVEKVPLWEALLKEKS